MFSSDGGEEPEEETKNTYAGVLATQALGYIATATV